MVNPYNHEYGDQPLVTLFNKGGIPTSPTTKILGVTLDSNPYVKEWEARAKSRLNDFRGLNSTTFQHSREFISAFYQQFVRPALTYTHEQSGPLT